MILSGPDIKKKLSSHITPFTDKKTSKSIDNPEIIYSYGLGDAGYDARLSSQYILMGESSVRMAPSHGRLHVMPGQSLLLSTLEVFDIPLDIAGRVYGKSTIARLGGLLNVTPLEPGWKGQITLEFTNLTDKTIMLMAGQGICQVQFEMLSSPAKGYGKGKYQDQSGPTVAKEG